MSIKDRVATFYENTNQKTGGRLDILKNTISNFSDKRGSQAAASLAYYAFFSLFPLLLTLVSLGSFFLNSEQTFQQVLSWAYRVIPVSQNLISQNLQRVLELRGSIGVAAIVGLIWSASGVFSGIAYNINLAWPKTDPRNYFEKRLIAISMVIVLVVLFLLSITLQTAVNILPTFQIPLLGSVDIYDTAIWNWFSYLTPWFFLLILYFSLYRWIPNRSVDFSAALWAAVVAATAWRIATEGFAWYLSSGFSRYELVYGSLGAIVALIFLIYLISLITLFGAHLSAAIQMWIDNQSMEKS